MKCRFCGTLLRDVFLDLGTAPPSNAFLSHEALQAPEAWFPLKLYTCAQCHLVQVDEVQHHEQLFAPDYAYFSSYSRSWLQHAEHYVSAVVPRLSLDAGSLVVEVASNDGYLLQYVSARDIPCVGVEPTAGTAQAARMRGIETEERFFGEAFARGFANRRGHADLIVANNVLAHVPDINDFVAGFAALLAPQGVVTIEFPHLLELVANRQFDTVYHEHFSYLSLHTTCRILAAHGLRVWDVESLLTHGGSLRIWACRDDAMHPGTPAVAAMLAKEQAAGMFELTWYQGFQSVAEVVKNDFLTFLLLQKRNGKQVAGYGAAAKGNTLLNFAGVRTDLLAFVADASPHKQGRYLPGARIPVVDEQHLREAKPDFVVVLPWNLREEITAQLAYIREWGGKFVVAVPSLEVL
ncbi:class I SAM-dependent methyltransferase [Thermomonas sp.]|uniref:class I SAM-dependent methyltransferase n=1 Tax=Thermomonas sp. TaxID=1971895 RepID=UPI00248A1E19|nr:class I SAM-dependent methyltransferase [Thermomonas sp.]MDI1254304.1 class I SAM-dependent methyltransferase [Thermomonas sp.]